MGKIRLKTEWILLILFLIVSTRFLFVESLNNKYYSFPHANVSSICPNNEITEWNTKNVSHNLRKWIRSVSIEWNDDERVPCGKNCKVFLMKQNNFLNKYAPTKTSPDIMMIGKMENTDTIKIKDEQYVTNADGNKPPKLHGPIWTDMHSGTEWNIIHNHQHGKLSGRVKPNALLKNGLYYGVLNNEELKLGRTANCCTGSKPL